jgi:hypothetical protein
MSQNIYQIYQANPITSNASTDLMYFGQSPYGAGDDAAMTYANFAAQFLTPSTGVISVQGTANQVLVNGTSGSAQVGAVTLTLPQSIATSSSVTFGSLALGTPLTGANGGTGVANTGLTINLGSATTGYVLTSDVSGNATWQAVSASGSVTTLAGDSGSATPSAGVITVTGGTTGLTTSGASSTLTLTGTLVVANGGSGRATATAYALLAGGTTATGVQQSLAAGTAGQLLQSGGASALPTWTTATFPSGSGTLNHMLRSDGTNWVQTTAMTVDASDNLAGLATVTASGNYTSTAGYFFSGSASGGVQGAITCYAPTASMGSIAFRASDNGGNYAGVLTNVSTSAARTWSLPDATGTIALVGSSVVSIQGTANQVLVNGTSGSPVTGTAVTLTTPQDIGTSSAVSFASVSTTGDITAGTSSGNFHCTTGVYYCGTATGSGANSGFVAYSPTSSLGYLYLKSVDNAGNYANILTNASTSAARTWTLPDASGTIALTSSSAGFTYNSVSGTTQTAVGGNAYILNNAAATTVTLPTSGSSTIGDTIKVKGRSSAAWIIQANTSQIITYGATQSTSAGTATSAAGTDSIQLVYVASNEWSVDWALSSGIVLA